MIARETYSCHRRNIGWKSSGRLRWPILLLCGIAQSFAQPAALIRPEANGSTPQTITFFAIPNKFLGVSPFPVAASASSGLAVSFAASPSTVCKNSGDLITLLAAGTCTITASQGGNATYSAAAAVMRSFTVSLAKGSTSFGAATGSPFLVGSQPYSVAVGDFNGDGNADLAVANYFDYTATVLLGNGSAGFTAETGSPFAAGTSPQALVAGDFNGDGILDLAMANFGANYVTVLLGKAGGGFMQASGSPFAVGQEPISIVAGDFNGDGILDLATPNGGTANVSVLLGNGVGGFAPAPGSPIAVGSFPDSVAVADFNGDGNQDLAVANEASGTVTVLLGDGSGRFAATGSPLTVGTYPRSLVVGDFNGDGVPDIAVANLSSNNVTVLMGKVSGGFMAATGSPFAVGSGPVSLVVGDFNGDGIQDLATANQGSNDVTVLVGNGSGGFTPAPGSPFAVGTFPQSVAVGDFNGDSIEDLAIANANDNTVTVLLGAGSGLTSQTITFGTLSNVTYGASPFTVGATSSSGLMVSFASTTSAVCTVTGNTVTIASGGLCSIVASQAGNSTYAPASVTQSFTVNPASQTISFAAINDLGVGVIPFAIGATASSGLTVSLASTTSSVCTVTSGVLALLTAGTCTIQATQTGNADYAAATPVNQSFAVSQYSPCDLKQTGNISVADVQLIINEALGVASPVNNLTGTGVVNVVAVQIEINAALGLGCAAK